MAVVLAVISVIWLVGLFTSVCRRRGKRRRKRRSSVITRHQARQIVDMDREWLLWQEDMENHTGQ